MIGVFILYSVPITVVLFFFFPELILGIIVFCQAILGFVLVIAASLRLYDDRRERESRAKDYLIKYKP